MPTITHAVDIDAPADRVFAILADPARLADYGPNVDRVEVVRQSDAHVGDAFKATYSVLGIHFPMTFTVTEYASPTTLVARFEGGMSGTWHWTLASQGVGGTRLSIRIDYQVPGGVVGKAANALLLERMNAKNGERILENLKLLAEAET